MPCILKTLHSSGYYKTHLLRARSDDMTNNQFQVVKNSQSAAGIALMVVFFALVGTAVVLIAVFCSKRKLDQECARESKVQLVPIRYPQAAEKTPSLGSSRTNISLSSTDKAELHDVPNEDRYSRAPTIRDRRGLPALTWGKPKAFPLPQLPPPTHRSEPRVVFPGVQYRMGQIGNDGRVHRPESIFEHLSP